MSRHTARARSGQDRTGLYQEITDKIIAELEAGRAPWVQPWGVFRHGKRALTQSRCRRGRFGEHVREFCHATRLIAGGFAGRSSD